MGTGIRSIIKDSIEFLRKKFSRENEELSFYLIILISFVIFIVGMNIFVELTEEVTGNSMENFDQTVTEYVTSFRSPGLNSFFIFITDLGDVYAYLVAMILVTIFLFVKLRSWKFIFQLLGVLILSALSNIALKKVFNRARPDQEHLVVIESLSYPSGHAMSAMAFYGFLIYLLYQVKMTKWIRFSLSLLFSLLILAIGTSRIYLGVHFPSDVAGGFVAGLIWVAFCIVLFNIIDLLRKRNRSEVEENMETN
ncbi:phosphatase PAP2 family protein [Salinimicrobium sp. GXAS 041]|uniref:phosphatase PAP2 family protein n=1 Tax=Salinimicrobium sp. GXAS 041 TaxID=3400806 RepID=UPI003C714123